MRLVANMAALVLVLGALLSTTGCSSTKQTGDVAKATNITVLLNEANDLIAESRAEFQRAAANNEKYDIEGILEKVRKAEQNSRRAMELSQESHKPRVQLFQSLKLAGLLELYQWESLNDRTRELRERGRRPSPEMVQRTEMHRANSEGYFRQLLLELDFYSNYLMSKFPLEGIHLMRSETYTYLGEWANAAQALRDHIDYWGVKRIKEERLLLYESQIEKFEELQIREDDMRLSSGGA